MSVHIGNILNAFTPSYPNSQWFVYLQTYSFRLSTFLPLALETFFMLSGFLLTLKFIQQPSFFASKNYLKYVLGRACRFWPGSLLITIVMLLLGEADGNWTSFWLFYQNYIPIERWSAGFASLWSISLDMQMHILLPILLHLLIFFRLLHRNHSIGLYVLVVLSVFYSLFVYNSNTMNISVVFFRLNSLALMMPPHVYDWIGQRYNVTLAFDKPTYPSPLAPFMESMYLPISSRYGSFIIGSILAFSLNDTTPQHSITYGQIRKYSYFTLIVLFLSTMLTPSDPQQVSQIVIRIMFSIVRQLFTMSQAFILFSTLCPSCHPYYSPWLKSFLSLRVWTPIAKLSYLIYILHFRIAFELIMTQRSVFDVQRRSFDQLVLLALALVLIVSLLIATLWHVLVEKPFERFVTSRLWKEEKAHIS